MSHKDVTSQWTVLNINMHFHSENMVLACDWSMGSPIWVSYPGNLLFYGDNIVLWIHTSYSLFYRDKPLIHFFDENKCNAV